MNLLESGYNPIYFRDGISWAVENIVKNLEAISKKVSSEEDLKNIATISSNNDSLMGSKIAEAFSYAGLNGTVGAEANPSGETTVRKIAGMNLKSGYVSSDFIVDKTKKDIVLENYRILIVNRDMTHFSDCISLFEKLHSNNYPVLVLTKDIRQEALATLVGNTKLGKLRCVATKIPKKFYNGDWLEDLSVMLGASIFNEDKGVFLSKAEIQDLGFAKKS